MRVLLVVIFVCMGCYGSDASSAESNRAKIAYGRRIGTVESLFAAAKVAFPPKRLLFRVFKRERDMEVWANDRQESRMRRIATYKICAVDVDAGPKRRAGDGKTPEGIYRIDGFNRWSHYHLSMKLNYPNRLDRALKRTGSYIMIHGDCVTAGCIAMTDATIEELWVVAYEANKHAPVVVYLFPTREIDRLLCGSDSADNDATTRTHWLDLKRINDAFNATHRLARITTRGTRYRISR